MTTRSCLFWIGVVLVPLQGGATTTEVDADVVIIGLGPVGMVLSHLLAAYGVKNVLAFERMERVYLGPRAVAWDDYTIRTSRSMGEEMESWMRWHARLFADQWSLDCVGLKSGSASNRGGSCDSYESNQRWQQHSMASTRQPSVYFHQPSWEEWLRRKLDDLPVNVSLNVEVTETAIVDGGCEVAVRSVTGGESRRVRARYCIGVDGGASATRKQLGLKYEGQTFPDQPWLVVDTEITDVDYLKTSWAGNEGSGFMMNPQCPMVFIATPAFFGDWWEEADQEAASKTTSPHGSQEFRRLRDEAMRRIAAERIPKRNPKGEQELSQDSERPLVPPGTHFRFEFLVPGNMTQAEATAPEYVDQLLRSCAEVDPQRLEIKRVVVYTFHARQAERWRVGPVLLAGDAAHCMPPFQGQGMNSGIRDAANIAWKLSLILRGHADDAILDSYDPERRKNLEQVTDQSIALGKLVMVDSPWIARIRDGVLWFFTWLRKKFDFFEGLQYTLFVDPPHIISDASLLAKGEGQQVAGQLLPCPDVWLGGEGASVPFDRLVAPNSFTLVLVDGPATDVLTAVLGASELSRAVLQQLGVFGAAVAAHDEGLAAGGAAQLGGASAAPVVQGLDGGGRCRDAFGHWTKWAKRYGLEGRVLLVRPDRYILGSFPDVDAAVEELSRLLRPSQAGAKQPQATADEL